MIDRILSNAGGYFGIGYRLTAAAVAEANFMVMVSPIPRSTVVAVGRITQVVRRTLHVA